MQMPQLENNKPLKIHRYRITSKLPGPLLQRPGPPRGALAAGGLPVQFRGSVRAAARASDSEGPAGAGRRRAPRLEPGPEASPCARPGAHWQAF